MRRLQSDLVEKEATIAKLRNEAAESGATRGRERHDSTASTEGGEVRGILSTADSGLVTNSILFCWLFISRNQCEKLVFIPAHNQGLRL